jgi:hypothetical protein
MKTQLENKLLRIGVPAAPIIAVLLVLVPDLAPFVMGTIVLGIIAMFVTIALSSPAEAEVADAGLFQIVLNAKSLVELERKYQDWVAEHPDVEIRSTKWREHVEHMFFFLFGASPQIKHSVLIVFAREVGSSNVRTPGDHDATDAVIPCDPRNVADPSKLLSDIANPLNPASPLNPINL